MNSEEANSEAAMGNDEAGCDEVRNRLIELAYDDFAGDSIGIDDRAALERHVSQCAGCREALGELRWTRDLVARAAAYERFPLDGFNATLRSSPSAVNAAGGGWHGWRRPLLLWCASGRSAGCASKFTRRALFSRGAMRRAAPTRKKSIVAADLGTTAEPPVQAVTDSIAAHQRRLVEINRLLDLMVTEMNRNSARIEATGVVFARRIDTVERQNNERWRAVGRGFHDWYLKQTLAQATLPPGTVQGEIR
jgi:hypothetical protein